MRTTATLRVKSTFYLRLVLGACTVNCRGGSSLLVMILDASDAPAVRLPRLKRFAVVFGFRVLPEEESRQIRLISYLILLLFSQIHVDVVEDLVVRKTSLVSHPRLELG